MVAINLNESMNLMSLLTSTFLPSFVVNVSTIICFEKEMYFSSLFGIQLILPSDVPMFLINK